DGDELVGEGVAAEVAVDAGEHLAGIGVLLAVCPQRGADMGHEQRGGYALADDIADDEAGGACRAVEGDEVVEVAAEFEAGGVAGGELAVVELRRPLGEHAALDVGGKADL